MSDSRDTREAATESLWTCASCGTDYNRSEMKAATRKGRGGVLYLVCTVCGTEGNFVDGPDA